MKMNLLLVLAWVALIATVSVSAKDHGLRSRDLEAHNEPDASDHFEGEENLLSPEEMEEMGLDEQDRDLSYSYGNGYGRSGAPVYLAGAPVYLAGTSGYGSGYGGYGRGSGYGSSGYGGYGSGYGTNGYGSGYGLGAQYRQWGSGYGSGYGSSGYGSGYGGYGSGYGGYGRGYGSGYGGYGSGYGRGGHGKSRGGYYSY